MPVGVVIPVHGWAPYLAEALDSVLAEAPAAVVVVDDGSAEPVALHPSFAGRVALVRREEQGGAGAARDSGVAALPEDVDLIAFCDADDAWEPGSLAVRVRALADAGAEVAGCFGRARIVGPDGRETGERWPEPQAGPLDPVALYEANPIPTSSVVLRRSSYAGFDPRFRLAEDWDLWLRSGPLVCVPDAVVRYRRHPGGVTADVGETARATAAVHEEHRGRVPATVAERVVAADRAALAAGLVRERRYAEARRRLPRGARRAALAVPGLRALAGRRDPYRPR